MVMLVGTLRVTLLNCVKLPKNRAVDTIGRPKKNLKNEVIKLI